MIVIITGHAMNFDYLVLSRAGQRAAALSPSLVASRRCYRLRQRTEHAFNASNAFCFQPPSNYCRILLRSAAVTARCRSYFTVSSLIMFSLLNTSPFFHFGLKMPREHFENDER